ncbi:hypothetical protein EVAR_84533_1 [Eumeta japonica]|uniref:Uncharacterized protein n=1 Tax=Eumeta variegata TaxID=151549 RepID=A0A4C1UJB3_EUMVA|nr:hypothetical protein EVAR_84533_1 [Eumeta japonica]
MTRREYVKPPVAAVVNALVTTTLKAQATHRFVHHKIFEIVNPIRIKFNLMIVCIIQNLTLPKAWGIRTPVMGCERGDRKSGKGKGQIYCSVHSSAPAPKSERQRCEGEITPVDFVMVRSGKLMDHYKTELKKRGL